MRRLLPIITAILLTACVNKMVVQDPGVKPIAPTPSAQESTTSVAATQPTTLEYGDSEAAEDQATTMMKTDRLPERILQTGIMEIGNPTAPIVLLVYTHQSCAYCHTLTDEVLPHLISDFIETGKVRYQIALLNIHKYPQSTMQSQSLICAVSQGKGLAMHRELFNQKSFDQKSLLALSTKLGLREDLFTSCVKAPGTAAAVQLQQSLAQSLDVRVVPTFFLNGEKFVGLPEYPDLRGRIEEALAKK